MTDKPRVEPSYYNCGECGALYNASTQRLGCPHGTLPRVEPSVSEPARCECGHTASEHRYFGGICDAHCECGKFEPVIATQPTPEPPRIIGIDWAKGPDYTVFPCPHCKQEIKIEQLAAPQGVGKLSPEPSITELARQQGVKPTVNGSELAGGFPADENVDEFLGELIGHRQIIYLICKCGHSVREHGLDSKVDPGICHFVPCGCMKFELVNPKGVEGVGQTARESIETAYEKWMEKEFGKHWYAAKNINDKQVAIQFCEAQTLTLRAELQQARLALKNLAWDYAEARRQLEIWENSPSRRAGDNPVSVEPKDRDFEFAMWLWLFAGLLFGVWNGPAAGLFMLCLLMFAWCALGLALKDMKK